MEVRLYICLFMDGRIALGYVHTTNSERFMAPREAIHYSMNSLRRRMGRHKLFSTHRTSCRRVWRKGLGALNSSPHS